MAVKISEDTNVQLDLKTIGIIIGFVMSLATVFFTLKADIALAKELPKPPITRADAALSILIGCSSAIAKYPAMNTIIISVVKVIIYLFFCYLSISPNTIS